MQGIFHKFDRFPAGIVFRIPSHHPDDFVGGERAAGEHFKIHLMLKTVITQCAKLHFSDDGGRIKTDTSLSPAVSNGEKLHDSRRAGLVQRHKERILQIPNCEGR